MKKSLGAQTLVFPTPTWLVGTYDQDGRPNAMAAAWGGICCSDPPCVAVSLRKATYTYESLTARRAFTLNIPSTSQVKEADYCGLVSGRETNKFGATGFTPVRSELVDAPFIEQCALVLECRVIEIYDLGLHTQFVGQILDVKADDVVLDEEGVPDMEKVQPILFSPGNRGYYGIGSIIAQAFEVGKGIYE